LYNNTSIERSPGDRKWKNSASPAPRQWGTKRDFVVRRVRRWNLETQMTVLLTNLRIAPRDQIAENAEIETLNR